MKIRCQATDIRWKSLLNEQGERKVGGGIYLREKQKTEKEKREEEGEREVRVGHKTAKQLT